MAEHGNKSKLKLTISKDVQETQNVESSKFKFNQPSMLSSVLWSGADILVHIGHPLADVDGFGGTWPP